LIILSNKKKKNKFFLKKKNQKIFGIFWISQKNAKKKISFSEISKNRKNFFQKHRSRKCVTEGSLKSDDKNGPFMHGTPIGDFWTSFDTFFIVNK